MDIPVYTLVYTMATQLLGFNKNTAKTYIYKN